MAGFKLAEIDGNYWKLSEETGQKTQIDASEYAQIQTARDTGPVNAAFIQAGSRINNALNKVGLGSGEEQTRLAEGSMDQLNYERPVSSFMGDMAAYSAAPALAAAVAPVASVGIPAAMGIGAMEGYALSNPGEGLQDTLLGGVGAGVGNMAGRIIQRINPFTKPAYKSPALTTRQLQTGKQGGVERMLANTTAGRGPANLFGRENQVRLNQLAADAIGYDGKQTRRLSPAMVSRTKKELMEQVDDLNISAQSLAPTDANAQIAFRKQQQELGDKLTSINMIDEALNKKTGNIDMDKLRPAYNKQKKIYADTYKANGGNLNKIARDNGLDLTNADDLDFAKNILEFNSQDFADEAMGKMGNLNTVMTRLDELTDPKTGAFFNDSTKAEEVLADVFRGILPGTGWASYGNFIPSLAPIGKGGNAGAFGGLLTAPALDNLEGQAAAELSNWLDDPDKNTLDRAADVGGAVLDAGKVGLLAVPGYKAGRGAARVIKGNLVN